MRILEMIRAFFSQGRAAKWNLDGYERVFTAVIAKEIERVGAANPDLEAIVRETLDAVAPDAAGGLLTSLKRRAPRVIRDHQRTTRSFQRRTYLRWKPGLDLLRMMLAISEEVGSIFNAKHRPAASATNDVQFEAVVNLHARALRVSEEIFALLSGGFPDGALARWRTLHELAVIMTILSKSEHSVAERFVLRRNVFAYQVMHQYRTYQDRANLGPIEDDEIEEAKARADQIVREHGNAMLTDYGWAEPIVKRKNVNRSGEARWTRPLATSLQMGVR